MLVGRSGKRRLFDTASEAVTEFYIGDGGVTCLNLPIYAIL